MRQLHNIFLKKWDSILLSLLLGFIFTSSIGLVGCSGNARDTYGPSTGGGKYVDENSSYLLKLAATDLADMIALSNDRIWEGFTDSLSKNDIELIIRNTKSYPHKEMTQKDLVTGEMKEKMFHYEVVNGKPEIQALRLFFIAYASIPIKFSSSDLKAVDTGRNNITLIFIRDIQQKLIHEVSHFIPSIGGNDVKAFKFASAVMQAFHSNYIQCDYKTTTISPDSIDMSSPNEMKTIFLYKPDNSGDEFDARIFNNITTSNDWKSIKERTFHGYKKNESFVINIFTGEGFFYESYFHPELKDALSITRNKISTQIDNEFKKETEKINLRFNYSSNTDNHPQSIHSTSALRSFKDSNNELSTVFNLDSYTWPWVDGLQMVLHKNNSSDNITVSIPEIVHIDNRKINYRSAKCIEHFHQIKDLFSL